MSTASLKHGVGTLCWAVSSYSATRHAAVGCSKAEGPSFQKCSEGPPRPTFLPTKDVIFLPSVHSPRFKEACHLCSNTLFNNSLFWCQFTKRCHAVGFLFRRLDEEALWQILKNNQTTIDKKQLEKAPCNFFIWFQGLGNGWKGISVFPLSVGQFVCMLVFFWGDFAIQYSVLSSLSVQMPLARCDEFLTKKRLPKPRERKNKWHTVDIPDAPCMDYLLTLGERCPPSRGNVGTYFLHGEFGYDI